MKNNAESIVLTREEAIELARSLDFILVSLNQIGSACERLGTEAYAHETTRFIDEQKVTRLLARCRRVLSDKFSYELGPDDMSELERALSSTRYWSDLRNPGPQS